MQELNNARNLETTLSTNTESCQHKPVYLGVVNINIDERTIGSVDVWRCVHCKKRFPKQEVVLALRHLKKQNSSHQQKILVLVPLAK